MSFTNFDTALVRQYDANVLMRAQQTESKLLGQVVQSTDVTGEMVFFNQYNRTAMSARTSRLSDLNVVDTSFERRAAVILDYEVTQAVDVFDIAKTNIGDPLNPVAMAQAAAMGRQIDAIITGSAFAAALGGKAGTTTNTFPAGNVVALNYWGSSGGSGNAGLTVPKILRAKKILDDNSVPLADRTIVCQPQQIEDMLNTTEVSSTFYNPVAALARGDVQNFAGFRFITVEPALLPLDSNGDARVIAMHRNALGFGMALDRTTANIFNDMKKGGAPTVFTLLAAGGVRRDDSSIVEIKCDL